jgi:hypothetical protein
VHRKRLGLCTSSLGGFERSFECDVASRLAALRVAETKDYTGAVTEAAYWSVSEHFKIQPPDAYARDNFGSNVALSTLHLVAGAPGNDRNAQNAGSVYVYRASVAAASFTAVRHDTTQAIDPRILRRSMSRWRGATAL